VDHALDLVAGPVTVAAGVVASAAVMAEIPPELKWPLAVIAGGGIAGLTKGSTSVLRAKSGVLTGGLANPVVSTVETASATGLSILAIVLPLLALAAIVALVWWSARKAGRIVFGRGRRERQPEPPAQSP
jgi:hypothetical protein